jgi:hypothetical protein
MLFAHARGGSINDFLRSFIDLQKIGKGLDNIYVWWRESGGEDKLLHSKDRISPGLTLY